MDNYPSQLAPDLDESGAVATPFGDWWARVEQSYPTVPQEVAKEWLHRHWGHSPFRYLKSSFYEFELQTWPSSRLLNVRSVVNNLGDLSERRDHGRYLLEEHPYELWLVNFMKQNNTFPTPIICLDNRDGHLVPGEGDVPCYPQVPTGIFLVEGHERFAIALHLLEMGTLKEVIPVWMMKPSLARK